MRILLLTQWFDPEPTIKGMAFAQALMAHGHTVDVLTGFPNYPGGRLYPGFRRQLLQQEIVDGIPITRVWLHTSHSRSRIGRAMNYLSFAGTATVLGSSYIRRPDVLYAYHPPITTAISAVALQRRWNVPIVLDIQDLWPDTLAATGMVSNARVLRSVDRVCQWIYQRTHRIAVLSPGFRSALIARGVPAEKIRLIYNWADERSITPAVPDTNLAENFGLSGRFNIMFAGTMGRAQHLHIVLEAAQLCASMNPRIQFVFVGDGIESESLITCARTLALPNVLFLPRQPMSAMNAILALADVALVHLRDDPLFQITIPSKTQAYLAAGKPILMGVRGDAAALIQHAGAGMVCEPDNAKSIADAACELAAMPSEQLTHMGRSGRAYYMTQLSLNTGVQKFEQLFCEAIATY